MSKKLAWYQSIAAISFLLPSYLLAGVSPTTHELIVGDYNGDGKKDVFSQARNTTDLNGVLLGNGSSIFNTQLQTFSNGHLGLNWSSAYKNIFSGDFNSDGRDDVLLQALNSSQNTAIVHSDINGNLSTSNQWANNNLGISWDATNNNLITGLFDNNTATDIILQGKSASSTHKLVTNQGTGLDTFVQWNTNHLNLEWSAETHVIHSGDYNGDGRSDVFLQARRKFILIPSDDLIIPIAIEPTSGYSILFSNTDGTFSTVNHNWDNNYLGINWLANEHNVIIADYNGDGKSDAFLQATSSAGTHYLLYADAQGKFSTIAQQFKNGHLGQNWSSDTTQLVAVDFNNDGKVDFINRNLSTGNNTAILADGNGLFSSTSTILNNPDNSIDLSRVNNVAGTEVFGSVGGSFGVTPSGSANYSIPISVPPGVSGIKPTLALNYVSQTSSGMMGVGWSMSGLSAISRCPQNYAQDNNSLGIELNNNDRLCLDGQRLVLVSGSYGKAGATYRTELDSFSIVIGSGDYNSSSSSFVVKTKAGQILNYGNSTDSKQLSKANGNVPIAWSINKVSDIKGNFYTVSYVRFSETEAVYPHRIDYTKNNTSSPALDSQHSVRFVYEGRTDTNTGYAMGDKVHSSKRLAQVKTYLAESVINNYLVNYETSPTTKRSRVKDIQVCNASNECFPATKFEWTDRELYATNPEQKTGLCKNVQVASDGFCNDGDNHSYIFYPDINGDGFSDLCYRGDEGIRCYKGTTNGIDTTTPLIDTNICRNGSGQYGVCNDGDNYNTIAFVDVNADGKDDLTYRGDQGIQVWLSNGTSFNNNISTNICANGASTHDGMCDNGDNYNSISFTDVNGDSLSDICFRGDWGIRCYLFNGNTFSTNPDIANDICANGSTKYGVCNDGDNHAHVNFFDVNADGKSDLVYRGDQGIQIWHSTGTAFINQISTDFCSNGSTKYGICNDSDNYDYIQYPDVNGDGLSDLCFRSDAGIRCHFNTGKTFSTSDFISSGICANGSTKYGVCNDGDNYNYIKFVDFNSDGKADLTYRGDNGIQYWLSTGTSFTEHRQTDKCKNLQSGCKDSGSYDMIRYPDINGDGISDFVYRDDQEGITIALSNGDQADLITKITDELQNETVVNYKLMTDSSVYTKGNDCLYPETCIQAAMTLVSSYTASNGVGGTGEYSYTYEGMRAHLLGRGMLGFNSSTKLDKQSNVLTSTQYHHVGLDRITIPSTNTNYSSGYYPYLGIPKSITVSFIGGDTPITLEETLNTSRHFNTVGASYFSYVMTNQVLKYDFSTGEVFANDLKDVIYDDVDKPSGNVSRMHDLNIDFSSGHTLLDIKIIRKEVTNTYEDNLDPSVWHLGRLAQAEVTHSTQELASDGGAIPDITRVSRFGYDPVDGLLAWTIENETDPNLYKKTSYAYDAFGNKKVVTVEGDSSATYPVSTRTSRSEYEGATFNTAYPVIRSTNTLLHESVKTIDARYGITTSTTGPNGLSTSWLLDSFGRAFKETRADGNQTLTTRDFCTTSTCTAVSGIQPVYFTKVEVDGLAPITSYFDQLGRKLRTSMLGLNNEIIYQDTQYNAKGQITQTSSKYFAGSSPIQWTVMTYDDFGRVNTQTAPNGRVSKISVSGFTTTNTITQVSNLSAAEQTAMGIASTRDLSSTKTFYANGKVKSVVDANGGVVKYFYNAVGNLVETQAPGETIASAPVITKISYNNAGQKTAMDDPDMGQWQYFYDAYGNLRKQINANQETTAMVYDDLNRMTLRIELEGINRWIYDNASDGSDRGASTGKLVTMVGPFELSEATYNQYITNPPTAAQIVIDGSELYKREFTYNSLGLAVNVKTTIDDGLNPDNTAKILNFEVDKTYDPFNRVQYMVYPQNVAGDRLTVEHVYNNSNGALLRIQNAMPDALNNKHVFWRLGNASGDTTNAINVMGQIQNETFGNGLTSIRLHNEKDGTIESITTGGLSTVQNLNYVFDNLGNLERRSDENQSFIGRPLHERFKYDNLGRLSNVTLNDISYQRFEYDAGGNMTYNSGFGYYHYDRSTNGRAHAVTNITSDAAGLNSVINNEPYLYDANGNQTFGANRGISYTSYNKPFQVVRSESGTTKMFSFSYGADHQRYKQNTPTKNIYYLRPGSNIGAHFEREEKLVDGAIKDTHYLYAGGNLVATYIAKSTNEKYANYHHRDHLGSVDIITDAGGFDVAKMSYAPFGERRNFDWTLPSSNTFISETATNYGFTGHEHIDDVGLIHMNGRVYDPKVGRFISADPHIQAPQNSQSYNRYSYVLNNPLSYTDPSGYFFKKFFKRVKKLAKKVHKVFKKTDAIQQIIHSKPVKGFFLKNKWARQVGTIVASIWGPMGTAAFSAYLTDISGGSLSDIAKSFAFSYVTASASAYVNNYYGNTWNASRVMTNSVVGGASAELSGGKFKDGFKTAFVTSSARLFYNEVVRYDTTFKPGGEAVLKTTNMMPVKGANNIGFQGSGDYSTYISRSGEFFGEGGTGSQFLNNYAPGVNAVAGLHDVMQVNMVGIARDVFNVPGMVVAAGITYAALLSDHSIELERDNRRIYSY